MFGNGAVPVTVVVNKQGLVSQFTALYEGLSITVSLENFGKAFSVVAPSGAGNLASTSGQELFADGVAGATAGATGGTGGNGGDATLTGESGTPTGGPGGLGGLSARGATGADGATGATATQPIP